MSLPTLVSIVAMGGVASLLVVNKLHLVKDMNDFKDPQNLAVMAAFAYAGYWYSNGSILGAAAGAAGYYSPVWYLMLLMWSSQPAGSA
jgi:hypothetical protein